MEKVKPPAPGIYENVPFDEYLKWDAFSKSMVKHILRSPAHLKHAMHSDTKSDAMVFGSLVDCMLLEPHDYDKSFAVLPATYIATDGKTKPWNNRSKKCKEYRDGLFESGKMVITEPLKEKAHEVVRSIRLHPTASDWLGRGTYQVSMVWRDDDFGVICKARIDIHIEHERLVDLKMSHNACRSEFTRTINNYLYHVQAAMYCDAYQKLTQGIMLPWSFIVAESEQPHGVAAYDLDEDAIMTGRAIYKKALATYKQCKELDLWPAYSQFAEPITIPAYAIMQDIPDEVINGI